MNVASPLCSTFLICSLDQSPARARPFFPWTKKVYPWGVPPIMSFRPRHLHALPLHQSDPWADSPKRVALLLFGSFRTVQSTRSVWWTLSKRSCSTLCPLRFSFTCCKRSGTFLSERRVWAPYSGGAPSMRWLVWPSCCPGITTVPAPWIMKSIVAKWLVSHIAFLLPVLGSIPSLVPFFLGS